MKKKNNILKFHLADLLGGLASNKLSTRHINYKALRAINFSSFHVLKGSYQRVSVKMIIKLGRIL